jgi:hypothetical protein
MEAAASGQRAVLYRDGRRAAELTGDLRWDAVTRTLTGRGGVTARSLDPERSASVRADTMRWRPDRQELRGAGRVLARPADGMEIPAAAFVADTALSRLRALGDERAATFQTP